MKITVPQPCNEKWEAMTPEEKGRFCTVCSKTVRDFREAHDDEIIDAFSNSSESICGNFRTSQLNRELHYSFINSLFVKFAVGFVLTTGGMITVDAQQCIPRNDVVKQEIMIGKVVSFPPVTQDTIINRTYTIGGAPSIGTATYQPLYVINGKIFSYEKVKSLKPGLIKKVQVLKGEKAFEIFAEKARGGVVIITTKKKMKK
ncbi:hypothetical protein C1631_005305 [Chryseobacterium phosphatilyticum]|uniref:TonB-dependent receptor plug domain-containing protein n=1 Tax=Chryseobacterium phosphatilyticum TaxID=475075 RepID=A0A316XFS0_9FLAO|nr:hypothetical protein [Chryseobacterium phosphatilyticum]PWN72029.1 hypothetical protein C1631_005305 [Chryseobacterium phosphatilyticum]